MRARCERDATRWSFSFKVLCADRATLSVSPRLLVLSEPTAGVDIGARTVLYDELRRRATEGLAVLMASSDLEDLLACCDRVIAVRDGVVAGEFAGARMTKSAIAYAMEGAHDEQH